MRTIRILFFLAAASSMTWAAATYGLYYSGNIDGYLRVVKKDTLGFTDTFVNIDRQVGSNLSGASSELDAILKAINWKTRNRHLGKAISQNEFERIVKECYRRNLGGRS